MYFFKKQIIYERVRPLQNLTVIIFYVLNDEGHVITNKMDKNQTRLIVPRKCYKHLRILILHA
jgi:hypothetical protein